MAKTKTKTLNLKKDNSEAAVRERYRQDQRRCGNLLCRAELGNRNEPARAGMCFACYQYARRHDGEMRNPAAMKAAQGDSGYFPIRLSKTDISRIEELAKKKGTDRSKLVRSWIEAGMAASL